MKFFQGFIIYLIALLICSNLSAQPVKIWESGEVYKAPESVAYDSTRGFLYISNYTKSIKTGSSYGVHYISKANLEGEILKLDWISNLSTPTGICIFKDKLYIVERFGVVEYDLEADSISSKYYIKTSNFLNDITVDSDTNIFVSESNSDVIYKIKNSNVETWLDSTIISKPNGILFDGNKLVVGVNSDSTIKSIDIRTKQISVIAQLKKGIIDGIKKCGSGFLVSHFEGNIYFISNEGAVNELINTRNEKINIADFEYIEEKGLIIIPALWNNKLIAYRYKP